MNRYLLVILTILALTSLVLSIISFTKCKDHFGGEILNPDDCIGLPPEKYHSCVRNMKILSDNINSQYQGQPANRGITYLGGPEGGTFGNPNNNKELIFGNGINNIDTSSVTIQSDVLYQWVTCLENNNIAIANGSSSGNNIVIYDTSLNKIKHTIGEDGSIHSPVGMTYDRKNQKLYAVGFPKGGTSDDYSNLYIIDKSYKIETHNIKDYHIGNFLHNVYQFETGDGDNKEIFVAAIGNIFGWANFAPQGNGHGLVKYNNRKFYPNTTCQYHIRSAKQLLSNDENNRCVFAITQEDTRTTDGHLTKVLKLQWNNNENKWHLLNTYYISRGSCVSGKFLGDGGADVVLINNGIAVSNRVAPTVNNYIHLFNYNLILQKRVQIPVYHPRYMACYNDKLYICSFDKYNKTPSKCNNKPDKSQNALTVIDNLHDNQLVHISKSYGDFTPYFMIFA